MMQVEIQFLPDNVTVFANVGEPLLQAARRAGVSIPTGCLSGACHACEVEIDQEPACACISAVPASGQLIVVSLYDDPVW
jgi:ferredoxin